MFFHLGSCIPLRIAPIIETDIVTVGKKFKKSLPKKHAFIFEDPKNADEFYNYINTKYEREHNNVEFNIPFEIENTTFYFSFHEIGIPTKTLNLIPIFLNAKAEQKGNVPIAEDLEYSRKDSWYIAITVSNDSFGDCLNPTFKKQEAIVQFLKTMRVEYNTTNNYNEALLKKQ